MPRSIESINKKSGRIIKKLASLSAMNLVIGVAFQVLFLFSVLQKNGVSGIIFGSEVNPTEFPSIVSIFTLLNEPLCAGTLAQSPTTKKVFVITSAVCVSRAVDNPKLIHVVIGDLLTYPNTTVPERQIQQIEKIIIHSQYDDRESYINNIAILYLKGDTKLAETVKPIKIADHDFQNHANCKVAGWGSIVASTNVIRPKRLQYAWVHTVPRNSTDDCYVSYNDTILIAHEPNGASGPWIGDDGAGLICDESLVGIFLYPLDCEAVKGRHFYTGYYTEVFPFRKWIETNSAFVAEPKMLLILTATVAYFMQFVF